jgi:toxin ParE1/3/4
MNYRVVFSPEAEEQLVALYGYIAAAASPVQGHHQERLVTLTPNIGASISQCPS